jgi:hypothetical protein
MPKNIVASRVREWPNQVAMHSFMATLALNGNARSVVVLYLVTVVLTAAVELSYSPAAQIICTRWQSGRHRKSRR